MLSTSAPLHPGHQPSPYSSLVLCWVWPCDLVLASGLWAKLWAPLAGKTHNLPCVILYSPTLLYLLVECPNRIFFFNLSTIGICSQTILCHGAFPCIIGYSEAFLISTYEIPIASPLANVATKMSPDTTKGPLKGRISPVENCCSTRCQRHPVEETWILNDCMEHSTHLTFVSNMRKKFVLHKATSN